MLKGIETEASSNGFSSSHSAFRTKPNHVIVFVTEGISNFMKEFVRCYYSKPTFQPSVGNKPA